MRRMSRRPVPPAVSTPAARPCPPPCRPAPADRFPLPCRACRSKTLDNSAFAQSCQKCPQKQQSRRSPPPAAAPRAAARARLDVALSEDAARTAAACPFIAVAPGTDETRTRRRDARRDGVPARRSQGPQRRRRASRMRSSSARIRSPIATGDRSASPGRTSAPSRSSRSSRVRRSSSTPVSACSTPRPANARPRSSTCAARSAFLSADEIEAYLRSERPYDCAGSVRSEALGIALFERIESDDPTALIGLPLIRLTSMLRAAGVVVLTPRS